MAFLIQYNLFKKRACPDIPNLSSVKAENQSAQPRG